MYSLLLIGDQKAFPLACIEESIQGIRGADFARVLVYPSIADLYPEILFEKPLVALIHDQALDDDLGGIAVLKKTFPHLCMLLIASPEKRALAARSITRGVDAYILEPYYMDELIHIVRRAFRDALEKVEQSLQMRMTALSCFIQGLAHEINNRLTPLRIALQLLTGEGGITLTEEEKEETYRRMQLEETRLANAITELENFAHPRRPKKNAVSLTDTLKEAVKEARRNSVSKTPVEEHFRLESDRVLIDRRQIVAAVAAVIRFLRENADEEKGRVVVSAKRPSPDLLHIGIEGFNTVALGEEVKNAFIPLYMGTIVKFGPELGLASAYGFIQAHGGSLEAEATSTGTRFEIVLPVEIHHE